MGNEVIGIFHLVRLLSPILLLFLLRYAVTEDCPVGKYGEDCLRSCLCSPLGTINCNNVTGKCLCKVGFLGRICDEDINECDQPVSPCKQAHTYCYNTFGSYECRCPAGFRLSPIGHCAPCPTFNYGNNCTQNCSCVIENTLFCRGNGQCACRLGWTGIRCDTSVDDCIGVTCSPGTICVDLHNDAKCLCSKGRRFMQQYCQSYHVHAVTLQKTPGVGELVEVYVLFGVPGWFLRDFPNVPDFEYQFVIDGKPKQKLCLLHLTTRGLRVWNNESFWEKFKQLDSHNYKFYAIVKFIFTEAKETILRMVPQGLEYEELVVVFDVNRKSQAEFDCLENVRAVDTSNDTHNPPKYKRQSYTTFEAKWDPSENCSLTPKFEWTFYQLPREVITGMEDNQCAPGHLIKQLNLNDLIVNAKETAISDQRSLKEVIPKGILPLGINLICVKAYVHGDKRLSASGCGYIDVYSSLVVTGNLFPFNEEITWPGAYDLQVFADFDEPDTHEKLSYMWSCRRKKFYEEKYETCPASYLPGNQGKSSFFLPADNFEEGKNILVDLVVRVASFESIGLWRSIRLKSGSGRTIAPMIIVCRKTCAEVVGTTGNIVLQADYLVKTNLPDGIFQYTWQVQENNRTLEKNEIINIFGQLETNGRQPRELFSTKSRSLSPGKTYKFHFSAQINILQRTSEFSMAEYAGEATYTVYIEEAPTGEGCSITPSVGEAVFTRFTLECKNYVDRITRQPLVYRLYQKDSIAGQDTTFYTLIAYSGTSKIAGITLSNRGNPGVSTVSLTAEIMNVRGTAEIIPLSVQLDTLDQKEILERIIETLKVQSGGQEDTRSMKDIASVLGAVSTASYETKVLIRREILKNMDKLDSDSAETVEHVSHALSISAEKDEEIEMSGLESGINAGCKLAKKLGKVGGSNIELTKQVAATQVHAVSNLLYVASVAGSDASTMNETENPNAKEIKMKNMNQSVMATNSFGNIASVLLGLLTSFNETVEMSTAYMDFSLALNNVSKDTNFEVDSREVKFHLPTLESGVLENEVVESEFEVFKKNPYGWTAPTVHGNLPVVKVNLVRKSEKHVIKKDGDNSKKTFRFSKPADIFLNYKVSSEETTQYALLFKTVIQENVKVLRTSSCVLMSVKVSTTGTTVLNIASPNNVKIMVKALYTNAVKQLDNLADEDMLEMPMSGIDSLSTPKGILLRDNNLLFLPQLKKVIQQMKRNRHFYRVKISLKLNQVVDTTSLTKITVGKSEKEDIEESEEYYNVTIEATPHVMSCLHFDEAKNEYLSDECTISMYSNLSLMYCRCLVAAAYTGSVVVLPRLINPLDIGLFLHVFENPLAVSAVIAVWMIYIALIAWGRRIDKEDEEKRAVIVLDDNKDDHNYVYLICVVTAWSASASTTSNVFIYLKGSWCQSENHILQDPVSRLFESGAENWFILATKEDVGELLSVVVWTDFSGVSPSWFLNSVYVQNMQTKESWICLYNSWISEHFGSGQLLAEIPALKEADYVSKWKMQIVNKGRNDIRNEHLWFGIIAKTSYNKFTRVRRLTTCLSLLQTLMILNLMFFGVQDKDDPGQFTVILGQTIHVTSLVIGIQTAIITFLLGTGISMLFNRVAQYPKPKNESEEAKNNLNDFLVRRKTMLDNEEDSSSGSDENEIEEESDVNQSRSKHKTHGDSRTSGLESGLNKNYNMDSGFDTADIGENIDLDEDPDELSKLQKKVFMLPWWFIYLTWPLLIIYNVFLAYYIMLYGLSLGYEKSVDWVLAFFTGFVFNVLIIQPIKVIAMVFLLVILFKQRHSFKDQAPVAKLNDSIILVQKRKTYNRKYRALYSAVGCKAPVHTAEANSVLERLAVESGAREMLRGLFLHTSYMIALLIVAYEHVDVHGQYLQSQQVKSVFLGSPFYQQGEIDPAPGVLNKILRVEEMWEFINTKIAPEMITDKPLTSTAHDSYLMGTARLRQVRSKSENTYACDFLPNMVKSLFDNRSCTYATFVVSEETNSYENTWTVLSNVSEEEIVDTPYIYRSSKELNSAPFIGKHGLYSGGGYVMTFGRDDFTAVNVTLNKLHNSDWIDQFTRCLFVEFTVYNPGNDHFTSVSIAFEFDNFGAIFPFTSIYSAMFTSKDSSKKLWLQISEGFVLIITLFYTVLELHGIQRLGFSYFLNLWSCLELATVVLAYTVGIFFFLRYTKFVEVMTGFHQYGHSRFMDFRPTFQYHAYLNVSLAFLEAVVIFKMLKVTAFNPFVVITFRSFYLCGKDFWGMSLVTILFLFNFALTGYLKFGSQLHSYMSIDRSSFTLLLFILGDTDYESLVSVDLYLGRIYYVLLVGVCQYIVLNFFCSILKEGYELTRFMGFKREQEIIKYMLNTMKLYSGFGPRNIR